MDLNVLRNPPERESHHHRHFGIFNRLDDRFRVLQGGRNWLLEHDGQLGGGSQFHRLPVMLVRSSDDDAVKVLIGLHFCLVGIRTRHVIFLLHLAEPFFVEITDSHNIAQGVGLVGRNVDLPNVANSYNAHLDLPNVTHLIASELSCKLVYRSND